MRQIKFKGKRKDGVWVYGSHVVDANDNHYILSPLSDKSGKDFWNNKFQYNEVLPETISQSTDLTDKNGKDGYHKDMVQHPDYGKGVIEWDLTLAQFYIDFGDGDDEDFKMTMEVFADCEIIGSIHDKEGGKDE